MSSVVQQCFHNFVTLIGQMVRLTQMVDPYQKGNELKKQVFTNTA